jgi:hypothetical protein
MKPGRQRAIRKFDRALPAWERWRPAGVFRAEAFRHPLAAGTAAFPGLRP